MSNIIMQCPVCSSPFQIAQESAGQVVACPGCNQQVAIPQDIAPVTQNKTPANKPEVSPPASTDTPDIFGCPFCQGQFGVTPEMFGQRVACPHCAKEVKIAPTPTEPPPQLTPPAQTDASRQESANDQELFAPGYRPKTSGAEGKQKTRTKKSKQNTKAGKAKQTKTDSSPPLPPTQAKTPNQQSRPQAAPDSDTNPKTPDANESPSKASTDGPARDSSAQDDNKPPADVATPAPKTEQPAVPAVNAMGIPTFQAGETSEAAQVDSEEAVTAELVEEADSETPPQPTNVELALQRLPAPFLVEDPARMSLAIGRRNNKILLPSADGGSQQFDQRIVTVEYKGERVELVARTPEAQARYRRRINVISILIGLIFILIAFAILMN